MPKLLPWEQLQEDVKRAFNEIDTNSRVTKGSGAVKGNGDVLSNIFMAECKFRTTDSFTINYKVIRKVRQEASLLGKIPLLVNRNKAGETLVTMTLGDLLNIINEPALRRNNNDGPYCP